MKLRYTRQALADLDEARAYIAERNPRAASATVARIRQSIDGLRMFPERGREGRIEGTRELVVPDTPFVVAYRIARQHVDVLAIFHGPHTYISPTWYEAPNTVPTWNYIAVHAVGVLCAIADRGLLREIFAKLVAQYESSLPRPWSMSAIDDDFSEKMLNGIVGFEIVVERLEG